jgi:hypothetical protein
MDAMFQLLWQRYRSWSDTSARLKQRNSAWKRRVLVLTIAGTALATLGPFADGLAGRVLPLLGATALACATWLGKELLDAKHEEHWTRARAAAEALKSEAHRYLVKAPPYDADDRPARLKARMEVVGQVTRGHLADPITPERGSKDMPTSWWTIDDYLTRRVGEQVAWYTKKAAEHSASMAQGRTIALALGGLSVLLGTVAGITTQGATMVASALGVVTTAAGSIGAYFQAGHYEATALKYRETADALSALGAEFASATPRQDAGNLVATAEAIMQAENAAWLTEITTTSSM